jgi:hypothetical protein
MVSDRFFPTSPDPNQPWRKGRHLTLKDIQNFIVLDEDIHLYALLFISLLFPAELAAVVLLR